LNACVPYKLHYNDAPAASPVAQEATESIRGTVSSTSSSISAKIPYKISLYFPGYFRRFRSPEDPPVTFLPNTVFAEKAIPGVFSYANIPPVPVLDTALLNMPFEVRNDLLS
jgi:hypothetical protein